MKATGIVRKVDDLGRIDPIEIYVDDDTIILRKHDPSCVFCGSNKDIIAYRGKNICAECAKALCSEL